MFDENDLVKCGCLTCATFQMHHRWQKCGCQIWWKWKATRSWSRSKPSSLRRCVESTKRLVDSHCNHILDFSVCQQQFLVINGLICCWSAVGVFLYLSVRHFVFACLFLQLWLSVYFYVSLLAVVFLQYLFFVCSFFSPYLCLFVFVFVCVCVCLTIMKISEDYLTWLLVSYRHCVWSRAVEALIFSIR